jgi:SAM-dependent methyltransferase
VSDRTHQLEYSTLQPEMHNEAGRRRKAAKILAVLEHFRGSGDLSGARVVDVGCSTGYIADEVRRAGARSIGVDIDVPGLAAAKANVGSGVGFLCADGEHLPLPDESVDIVIFNHIYEHVVDADAVVAEIVRVLKTNGLVYLGLGNRWGVIEPHYGLPFLSWLPHRLADRYVRAFGRADAYYERFRGLRGLKRMLSKLDVWDYTESVLADPAAFSAEDLVPGPLDHVPSAVWRLARPLIPTFIWVGTKGSAAPAGPRLHTPPRFLNDS